MSELTESENLLKRAVATHGQWDLDQAELLYQQLLDEYPNTEAATKAKEKLELVTSQKEKGKNLPPIKTAISEYSAAINSLNSFNRMVSEKLIILMGIVGWVFIIVSIVKLFDFLGSKNGDFMAFVALFITGISVILISQIIQSLFDTVSLLQRLNKEQSQQASVAWVKS